VCEAKLEAAILRAYPPYRPWQQQHHNNAMAAI